MTKAVILEIKDGYAAVLTDEGLVQRIPDRQYTVGQEIILRGETKRRFAGARRAAAAAAVIAVLSGGGLYYVSEYTFAYSTVTVSTENTSVELTLNRKNEVVAAKALNEKSKQAASSLKVSSIRRGHLEETLKELAGENDNADVRVESRNEKHRQILEEEVTRMVPPKAQAPETEEPGARAGAQPQTDSGIPQQTIPGNTRPEQAAPQETVPEDVPSPQVFPQGENASDGRNVPENGPLPGPVPDAPQNIQESPALPDEPGSGQPAREQNYEPGAEQPAPDQAGQGQPASDAGSGGPPPAPDKF